MPWTLPTEDTDLLALARGYPFAAPGRSYLYRDGAAIDLAPGRPELFEHRVPVIAHGSNRSPDQMRRKFDHLTGADSEIPVTRVQIDDYDAVYSAHITRYGSVAANLHHMPGVRSELYLNWLNSAQLDRMHETELGGENYVYGRLEGVKLYVEGGPEPELAEAYVYISVHGCLAARDAPEALEVISLAAVSAEGRRHRALSQEEVLCLVRDRHRVDSDLDTHILATIRDVAARKALVAEMRRTAVAVQAPHFVVLAV